MRPFRLALALALMLKASAANGSDPVRIVTPRDAAIEVLKEKPNGNAPFPAVILGSGAEADMHHPIFESIAKRVRWDGATAKPGT